MPTYTIKNSFWRQGKLLLAGEKVSMTEAEAKYLSHAIEKDNETVRESAPKAKQKPAEVSPMAVSVVEKPDTDASKQKASDNGKSGN